MIVIAQQGDTVDSLCHRHLGRTSGIVEATLEANPGLAALGAVLPMGTAVELPDSVATAPSIDRVQLWS